MHIPCASPNDANFDAITSQALPESGYYKDYAPVIAGVATKTMVPQSSMDMIRKREEAVLVREVDQEVLILDTEFNLIHKLNQTASFIWRALEKVHSTAELARMLANAYEVEQHVAVNDVTEALRKLHELKLVADGGKECTLDD